MDDKNHDIEIKRDQRANNINRTPTPAHVIPVTASDRQRQDKQRNHAENKWRAVRFGIEGKLIDFGKVEEVPMRVLAIELLEFVDDVVDELDIRKEVEYVHSILENGTSADRQLMAYRRSGDLRVVVDQLVEETKAGWD